MKQQIMLPCIPRGATAINNKVGVFRDDNMWTYVFGGYPIHCHKADDRKMFRLVTSQLIESGACRQVDIIKTFAVSKSSVIRYQNLLRTGGSAAFFKARKVKSGGRILTEETLAKAQSLFDDHYTRSEVSQELNIKYDTLRKAINDGRLKEREQNSSTSTTKSARNVEDAKAAEGMGTACTRIEDRVDAIFGFGDGAVSRFEHCLDVPKGGVLCALPALLENGLLHGAERLLGKVGGYYRTLHILLLLAFMSLCRIKTVEKLRGHAPGEFGNLLGLDRIPEVRCLRMKLDQLSIDDSAKQWATHLSKHWMESHPTAAGTLYVDGHVRVYHGGKTKLPRKFVSRERLCLRGMCDYWVNDATGNPFFVVEKTIDPGMLQTLRHDIVPQLLQDVPNQPTEEELKANSTLSRLILVFDREGYSPAFFKQMWEKHRISCITYHKYPDDAWPEDWFIEQEVVMPRGETVTLRLAEMGSLIGSGKDAIWVREVRKLTSSCHQTSLISTAYALPHKELAARMFSRWCQENFFGYMMHHFAIDLLTQYETEDLPAHQEVINPTWRELTKLKNSVQNKPKYRQARFAEMTIHPKIEEDTKRYRKWVQKKADLLEEIQHFENELNGIKTELKEMPRRIPWENLKENDKFQQLAPGRKHLLDTVKMIGYRAETAMAGMLLGPTTDTPAARQLLQDLFVSEADIIPDTVNKKLRVKVHAGSRPAVNKSLRDLFEKLNESEIIYPGTDLQLVYEILGIST
jgi:prepilin-type processing-associated H-X9-DG protein